MIKVEILERKMQELGLNLSSLAQLSGVDKSTLSRILNKELSVDNFSEEKKVEIVSGESKS